MSFIHPRWAYDGSDYMSKAGEKLILYETDTDQSSFITNHEVNQNRNLFENHEITFLETITL